MDISGFVSSLRAAKRSPATIRGYRNEVERFERFLRQRRLRITQATPKVVLAYVEAREAEGLSNSSVRHVLTALSAFFEYARITSDGRVRNPAGLIRRPRRQMPNPTPVDDDVLDKLLAGITNARDRAIVMLFTSTGLRLAELASLNKDSIQIEKTVRAGVEQTLGVGRVVGKGAKEREFLVDREALHALKRYWLERDDHNPALFISNRGGRMSPRAIEHMIYAWCDKLHLPRSHPHAFRHWAGTTWRKLGIGMLEISRLLGHSSVATTQLYVKPDEAQLRAEYFAALETLNGTTEEPGARHEPLVDRPLDRKLESGTNASLEKR